MTSQHTRAPLVGLLALGALAGTLAVAKARARETTATETPPSAEGALAIGQEAYVYGYPMMVVDETKQAMFKGVTNHFAYMKEPPPPANRAVVRPNADTLYTTGMLDLAAQPIVVHVPDSPGRYYLVEMMDANTNVFASPGTRTSPPGAHDYVIVGPNWKDPVQLLAGMTELHAPTNQVWIIARTQLNGDKDIPAVNAIQKQFAIAPYSEWPKGAVPAVPYTAESVGMAPPDRVKGMNAPAYFDKMAMLLQQNPPSGADGNVLQRFATIGLVPGHPFQPSPDLALTLERSKARALEAIASKAEQIGEERNGWRMVTKGIGTYGTDYLQRAAVTDYGLGANLPQDAVYPGTHVDATGQALDGHKQYVLHLAKDQIPPVNAFWSLTMYDKDGYFVANPINRFNARDALLKKNPDGSIDIYLQANSPGKDREQNWLPAPKDAPFTVLLRMYWPKQPVLDGSYAPPAIQLGQAR